VVKDMASALELRFAISMDLEAEPTGVHIAAGAAGRLWPDCVSRELPMSVSDVSNGQGHIDVESG
jgi:hypothetical protein